MKTDKQVIVGSTLLISVLFLTIVMAVEAVVEYTENATEKVAVQQCSCDELIDAVEFTLDRYAVTTARYRLEKALEKAKGGEQ